MECNIGKSKKDSIDFTRGSKILGIHAKACGNSKYIKYQCMMCCNCWCHYADKV